MKKQVLAYLARTALTLSLFVAFIGAGTASAIGVYQPEVPKSLIK